MRKHLRILHLEDDPVDGELVRIALSRAQMAFEIKAVSTRSAFLSALIGENFDVILSDSGVPGFPGESALEIVREEGVSVPFIYVSGYTPEGQENGPLRVSKLNLDQLPGVIERALRETPPKQPDER
jgi:hypothetical protein